jgi:hypothetical protein
MRSMLESNQHMSMFTLRLSLLRKNRKSSVDVDQIYALLGLCGKRTDISPDYNKSREEVYMGVVEDHFQQFSLLPLALSGVGYGRSSSHRELASWAFDWTQRTKIGFNPIAWSRLYEIFHASTGIPQEFRTVRVKAPHLYLHAILLDRALFPLFWYGRSKPGFSLEWYNRRIDRTAFGHGRYLTGETWEDAFFRTSSVDSKFSPSGRPRRMSPSSTNGHLSDTYGSYDRSRIFIEDSVTRNHKLCVTENNYIGLCPPECRQGTQVFIVGGCNMPVILEEVEGKRHEGAQVYKFWGCCYLHGFMDGIEKVKEMGIDLPKPEKIVLI